MQSMRLTIWHLWNGQKISRFFFKFGDKNDKINIYFWKIAVYSRVLPLKAKYFHQPLYRTLTGVQSLQNNICCQINFCRLTFTNSSNRTNRQCIFICSIPGENQAGGADKAVRPALYSKQWLYRYLWRQDPIWPEFGWNDRIVLLNLTSLEKMKLGNKSWNLTLTLMSFDLTLK